MKVFISHSSQDKRFVRTLKSDLKENSLDIWLDEDQLDLGDSLIDKLELALEESSHFLIILSPFSVNSDWVKFELNKALKQKESALLNKIIPIQYRKCEIPEELKNLIYADLSDETVQIVDNSVKFISDGYQQFLLKLTRAIRNSDKKLTQSEKSEIKKNIKRKEQESISNINKTIKANYSVIGYKDFDTRKYYESFIKENTPLNSIKKEKEIRPVLLPPLLKSIFKELKIGDRIVFTDDFVSETYGHFAGYRKDDISIAIDPRTRKGIGIERGYFYQIEINVKNKQINFIKIIK